MRTIITLATALLTVSSAHAQDFRNVTCEGTYPHHLQGTGSARIAVPDEKMGLRIGEK